MFEFAVGVVVGVVAAVAVPKVYGYGQKLWASILAKFKP